MIKNKNNKIDKNIAVQTVGGIYTALQSIPVTGENNITVMAGIFQALKELGQYLSEEKEIKEAEEGGNANDK